MRQVRHGRAFIEEETGKLGILYVNADSITQQLLHDNSSMSVEEANQEAQKRADAVRHHLAERKADFAWESVASHPSKVDFLEELHGCGYSNAVLLVSTEDPSINIRRVKQRARFGGHDVPPDKVESRYCRMSDLIPEYYSQADLFVAFDNSKEATSSDEESARLLVVKDSSGLSTFPACGDVNWIHTYLLNQLN